MNSKKLLIIGSAMLSEKIAHWRTFWEQRGFEVIAAPKSIPDQTFINEYPQVHIDFFRAIEQAHRVFVMNEDKEGVVGYIGAECFAELAYAVTQNLIHGKRIEVLLLQMPEKRVPCFDEITLWLKLQWIKLYEQKEFIQT